MRVLTISRAPWRNDNNIGNTFSNIFSNISDAEIYSVCMRDQLPNNNIVKKNFCISEGQLIKSVLKRAQVGKITVCQNDENTPSREQAVYDVAKKCGFFTLAFAREMLWSIGKWKNQRLIDYINETNPEVIFMPVFNCFYPHKLLKFIGKHSDAKIVLFHADDNYTLRQYSLSPIFWIYRFILRKWVRSSVSISSLNYVISEIQKIEYEKAFKCECKVLTKYADFTEAALIKSEYNSPLQMVFTGNIGLNRWKSLKIIADALEELNSDGVKAQMKIYTATPLTKRMAKALNRGQSSKIVGCVPASEVEKIQMNADMLIHVEAFDIKNRLTVRQSFSTKIVDYLKACRPILAVGPDSVASIDHLIKNDCAIVAQNKDELVEKLKKIVEDNSILVQTAAKGYECGRLHHNKADMQRMLVDDFNSVLEKS